MTIYILKFNKVTDAPKEFWDLVQECVIVGKDKDYIDAVEKYKIQEDKTLFFIECSGMNSQDDSKKQAYRRGAWFKDRLTKFGLKCPYFQVYKKREKK